MPALAKPRARARAAAEAAEAVASPGRAYGGLAAEDRVAARRARFVEAGVELFGTQGFRAATVRGVCAAAGLTDRYFYESFASLEALLVAVFESLMRDFSARVLEQSVRSQAWAGDAAAVERQAARGYELWFDAVREPRFARIVLVEVLGVSPAVDALYERALREVAELVAGALESTRPPLALPPARRAMIGRALVGAALQVARAWVNDGYRAPRREVVRTCVLVATGTLAALRAEA